jgi:hypothetical protein
MRGILNAEGAKITQRTQKREYKKKTKNTEKINAKQPKLFSNFGCFFL